jgi:DNA-binding GntR family transcriptional regulator
MKTGLPVESQRRAYEKVRELILLGQLKPGARVSQVQLAAELELSRTPLREALRRLETEGLVQLDFNRRLRVAPLSVPDLESLYALRILSEPLAVRLSTTVLSERQLAAAAEALADTNAAADQGDEAALLEAHRRFHFILILRQRIDCGVMSKACGTTLSARCGSTTLRPATGCRSGC